MFEALYGYIQPFVSFTETEKQVFENAFSFLQMPKKFTGRRRQDRKGVVLYSETAGSLVLY
jgi:hypothetical protein